MIAWAWFRFTCPPWTARTPPSATVMPASKRCATTLNGACSLCGGVCAGTRFCSRACDWVLWYRKETVYVHCMAGKGRSVTLVLCYLVAYEGMS